MSIPISSLMSEQVQPAGPDDTILDIERRMVAQRLSWVPVLSAEGAPMGVISATDLLRFHAEKGDAAATPAWLICTYKPIAVAPQTPAREVAALMIERKVHHVVVSEGGNVRGVVSSLDFVREYAAARAA